jgi:2-polyprenyl-3-methyl-5-hydroxy-6-metoxy-1,4-benzoquinol methylase
MKKINVQSWEPLGIMLLDYFKGDQTAECTVLSNVEEDSTLKGSLFFRNEGISELETIAINHCEGKILEIGAGVGIHSLELQNAGYDITAVEISQHCSEIMKTQGIKNIINTDFFSYEFEQKFDTILLLMNGIGFVEDFKGLERFFLIANKILETNGKLIFDTTDISYATENQKSKASIKKISEYFGIVWYSLLYKNWVGKPYKWLYLDYTMLKKIALKNGFKTRILHENDSQYLVECTRL